MARIFCFSDEDVVVLVLGMGWRCVSEDCSSLDGGATIGGNVNLFDVNIFLVSVAF